jgi:hypothetical protein
MIVQNRQNATKTRTDNGTGLGEEIDAAPGSKPWKNLVMGICLKPFIKTYE